MDIRKLSSEFYAENENRHSHTNQWEQHKQNGWSHQKNTVLRYCSEMGK